MSSSSKKRRTTFNEKHQKEFPHIKIDNGVDYKDDSKVRCSICNIVFSIEYGGKHSIVKHNESNNHKKNLSLLSKSTPLTNFFLSNEFTESDRKISLSELVFAYHTVNHNQSFNSMSCTTKLIQTMYNKRFSCGKSKCSAITKKVLYPYFKSKLENVISKVNYLSIMSDASNHNATKLFPLMIQYFDADVGIETKILNLAALPGETSDIINNNIMEVLRKHDICQKVVALTADNTNTNFGGLKRRGEVNVFTKLKTSLDKNIFGLGCNGHIANNAIDSAAGTLPVDIEGNLIQIYLYFKRFTVRTENLKLFCEEASVEYSKLLGFSKTRWLALRPAIERIYKLFEPLKSYFLSQEKLPKSIRKFFENESTPLYLQFLHQQASIFHEAILKMERNNLSSVEAYEILNELKLVMFSRQDSYIPLVSRNILTELEQSNPTIRHSFEKSIKKFHETAYSYLNEWTKPLEEMKIFEWILLQKKLEKNEVIHCLEQLMERFKTNMNIDDLKLSDEISRVNIFLSPETLLNWNSNKEQTDKKWVDILTHLKKNEIPHENLLKLLEICLCLPATNAAVERSFSIINNIWTGDKSALGLDTLTAQAVIKVNSNKSCNELMMEVEHNDDLLKQVKNSNKYN